MLMKVSRGRLGAWLQITASMWVPLVKPFLPFYELNLPSLGPSSRGHPFVVELISKHEEIQNKIQSGKGVAHCYISSFHHPDFGLLICSS